MGVDYLQYVVQTDAEAATSLAGILFVLSGALKAVEDGLQFALLAVPIPSSKTLI